MVVAWRQRVVLLQERPYELPHHGQTWHQVTQEIMSGMCAWRLQHPKATLREMELDRSIRTGRTLQDIALASAAADWADTPASQQPTCPDCGTHLQLVWL